MNQKLVVIAALGVLLISCSTETEDFEIAADKLCKCMNDSGYDGSDSGNIKMNMGVCLLDAIVDLKDPRMLEQLEKKCPDIKDGFEAFVDGM